MSEYTVIADALKYVLEVNREQLIGLVIERDKRIALLRKALEMATKGGRYTVDDWLVLAKGEKLVAELQEKGNE